MSSLEKPVLGAVANISFNAAAAFGLNHYFRQDRPEYVVAVVAVDTAFRIALVHVLRGLKLSEVYGAGRLIFPCLTLVTQPLSQRVVENWIQPRDGQNRNSRYLRMMAYIFFGWKANMMVKELFQLTVISL